MILVLIKIKIPVMAPTKRLSSNSSLYRHSSIRTNIENSMSDDSDSSETTHRSQQFYESCVLSLNSKKSCQKACAKMGLPKFIKMLKNYLVKTSVRNRKKCKRCHKYNMYSTDSIASDISSDRWDRKYRKIRRR